MTINGKQILKRLEEQENDRGKHTLYLSKSLLEEFKVHCGERSASIVIEALMKEFIKTTDRPKPKKR